MCIHQTKTCVYLLVVSNPSSNGHFCLVVVDALVGGQQSNESQTGSHHSSVERKWKGIRERVTVATTCTFAVPQPRTRIRLFVLCNSEIDWPSDRSSWSFSLGSYTKHRTSCKFIGGNKMSPYFTVDRFLRRWEFLIRSINYQWLTNSLNFTYQ